MEWTERIVIICIAAFMISFVFVSGNCTKHGQDVLKECIKITKKPLECQRIN